MSLPEENEKSTKHSETGHSTANKATNTSDFWALMGCNFLVFTASVCIMVLELTASRLIAKHVGNSLYTWTSVIGVVLAGITLGNYLGGWLADRYSHRKTLSWLFLVASVLCFSVLLLDQLIGGLDKPSFFDLQWWILFTVAAVYLLPAVALGTISPVVASMALKRSMRTGMTIGNVYAWGALGSIVGTFLTGFYLLDIFGTRAIVAMTAATLAVMGILSTVGQRIFLVAVVLGWMQFILFVGMAAAAEESAVGSVAGMFGACLGPFRAEPESTGWERFGYRLGEDFHRLGLTLGLRNDELGEYHDESNYSYINVSNTTEDGDRIRYLKLDKLIHSYFNPNQPTKLYYEYEQVYAAVTELAASSWKRTRSVPLKASGDLAEVLTSLPDWCRYNRKTERLEVTGAMSADQYLELIATAPDAGYWQAIEKLHEETNMPSWGGFTSVGLDRMPNGVAIPEPLVVKIRFDPNLKSLIAYDVITDKDLERLLAIAPKGGGANFYRAAKQLHGNSRQVSTMFIGGGGFVFPRWIEAEFPERPRIEVAELDPAVKKAVEEELGLIANNDLILFPRPDNDERKPLAEGETAVRTYVGDARNFVDDCLDENARRDKAGLQTVQYDFIYGDAFNDYSVPWHLATVEFARKVRSLLTPGEGVYLINIIDVYPRTEYPGGEANQGETTYVGELPPELFVTSPPNSEWMPADEPYSFLEVQQLAKSTYRLRIDHPMTDEEYDPLKEIASPEFKLALIDLFNISNDTLPFEGHIPASLFGDLDLDENRWTSCRVPFENIEVEKLADDKYHIAVRGLLSARQRDALFELEPENKAFRKAADELYLRSNDAQGGRFLGSFVNTVAQVFPNVYVFSSNEGVPSQYRDTYVLVASLMPLDFGKLNEASNYWSTLPFAALESKNENEKRTYRGHMKSLLRLANHLVLSDDHAPVDNLLRAVFMDRD